MRCAIASALIGAALLAAVARGASTTPPVSSLRTLPAPPKLPAGYVHALEQIGKLYGFSPKTAERRTRLLLSNVTGLPLYAFAVPDGPLCFMVWRGLADCGTLDAAHHILWGINGGSWKRGQAVVGLAADNVRAVDVYLGTRHFRATVRHNAFVVPVRIGRTAPDPEVRVAPVMR